MVTPYGSLEPKAELYTCIIRFGIGYSPKGDVDILLYTISQIQTKLNLND